MKRILNRTAGLAAAALIIFFSLIGCGDTGSGPVNNPLVKPKAGTTYVFDLTRFDTNGVVRSTRPQIFTVLSTTATLLGEMNLTSMVNSTEPHDTGYVRFESNNDVTFIGAVDANRDGIVDGAASMLYPISSRKKIQIGIDTNYSSGSYTIGTDSMYYVGEQSLTVPAGTFTVSKVVQVGDYRNFNDVGVATSREREIATFYFAPSIGFFAKRTWEHEFFNADGSFRTRHLLEQMELKSYDLKK